VLPEWFRRERSAGYQSPRAYLTRTADKLDTQVSKNRSPTQGRVEARDDRSETRRRREVGALHKSEDAWERSGDRTWPSKGSASRHEHLEGPMTNASTFVAMSPRLQVVAERAKKEPAGRFHSLAHLMDASVLQGVFERIRKNAAVGIDGVSKQQYEEHLQENLQDLLVRLKSKRYRHQPIRRVNIPKPNGKTRPIGVSTTEDKIVQGSIREVLETVYEQDFLECSYGFRRERNAHDAVRALNKAVGQGEARWILEADIETFFDSLDRSKLREMLEQRVADGSLMRLIGKCLRVGVLDGYEYIQPERGTAQGSALSPLLGNIYLHYALDMWFETEVKPRLNGRAKLIRYADDFVICFETRRDAQRVQEVLPKRMERYSLKLHPAKTRLLDFRKPTKVQGSGKGPSTFDFLGFTFYWRRSRKGRWMMACKTKRASFNNALRSITDFCRRHRHLKVKDQHASLCRRLVGHFNYFGVNGNGAMLNRLRYQTGRIWLKWLRRRSDRTKLTWKRFKGVLKTYPLPYARIRVQIWGT